MDSVDEIRVLDKMLFKLVYQIDEILRGEIRIFQILNCMHLSVYNYSY